MRYDPRIMIFKSPGISFRTDTNYKPFNIKLSKTNYFT